MSTPSVRRRATPAERTHEIRDAAIAIARESGLPAVTLRAVAARAGVTPALVAHYIDGTEQLAADAFSAIVADELESLLELVREQPRPRVQMATLLRELMRPERLAVTAIWVDGWALGRRHVIIAAQVRHEMDRWRNAVAEIISAGRVSGDFPVVDVEEATRGVLAMIDGINSHALVGWNAEDGRAALLQRAVDAILRVPADAEGVGLTEPDEP
jgi:AcrR family transcriptional regulator